MGDKVIFLTEEEAAEPSKVSLGEPEEHPPGLILPNGDINWNCPCLGGMAVGPCGIEFREAFSCFHYSEAEPKGSDCLEKFNDMQQCFQKYPELFEETKKEKKEEESSNKTEEKVANSPSDESIEKKDDVVEATEKFNQSSIEETNIPREEKITEDIPTES